MGMGFPFGMMKMFCNETVVMGAQPCEYTKKHWMVYFKRVNFRHVIYILIKKKKPSFLGHRKAEWRNPCLSLKGAGT